jgi:hypothetical protein
MQWPDVQVSFIPYRAAFRVHRMTDFPKASKMGGNDETQYQVGHCLLRGCGFICVAGDECALFIFSKPCLRK